MGAMKPIRTTVGLLCTLVISACSLLQTPIRIRPCIGRGCRRRCQSTHEDLIPPVTGQQMLDADVDQGVIPDARPPRMQDAAVLDEDDHMC